MNRKARLILSTLIASLAAVAPAHAFPVFGFLGGIIASFGIATPLIGVGALGAVNAGFAFGTFLASSFGSALLSIGLAAAQYFLGRQKGPTVESARVTVRLAEPERWIHGGRSRAGGAAMFGEYDDHGSFWAIFVHGDSILTNKVQTILDELPVTFDNETNDTTGHHVITDEFTKDQKAGSTPVFRVWTRTYDVGDPVPPALAEFKTKFPAWTDDHKLAGTCFSIMNIIALKPEDRYKVLTWRGVFGLGEPNLSVVADWSRMYDPRPTAVNALGGTGQDIDDPATWVSSRNMEIVWAWFRTHPYGRNKPMDSIDWANVAIEADKCDATILDKNSDPHPRYHCGISVPDSKERHVGESEILLSGDAILIFNEVGKCYAKVGVWEEPDVTLSAKRDIITMSSRDVQDGETETDGVIVKYIDPEFNWIAQPSAPWKNPLFYEDGKIPRYLTVEILACQDHNQAVRLAKAIGEQSQPAYKLAPSIGLRGLKLRRRRVVNLVYDATYTGYHLIATPVEIDEAGQISGCGMVPVTPNHWTLLEGEEGDKPIPATPITYDKTLANPTSVVFAAVPVEGSDGTVVRIEATFTRPTRIDYRYEFQYRLKGSLVWKPFLVLMDDELAYTDTVTSGSIYELQGRTVTTTGRASDWHSYPDFYVLAYDPSLNFSRESNSMYLPLVIG